MKDSDEEVQEMAAWALGLIGDNRALNALRALEQDESQPMDVRSKARWALGMIR